MHPTEAITAIFILTLCTGITLWSRSRRKRLFLAAHTIQADELHAILFATNPAAPIQLIDVRQPLDLLASSQIIPGSRRIPPKEIIENPDIFPRDQDTIVYCTCPSDQTAGKIMQRAVSLGFERVKVLHGGLDAWKEKSYPTEPYKSSFHLDTPA